MTTSASAVTVQVSGRANIMLTNPTGRLGSASLAASNRGSKYARAASVWDSGSLARLHRTTQGWFLSRAMSSSIAWRCTSCVAALIVSSE